MLLLVLILVASSAKQLRTCCSAPEASSRPQVSKPRMSLRAPGTRPRRSNGGGQPWPSRCAVPLPQWLMTRPRSRTPQDITRGLVAGGLGGAALASVSASGMATGVAADATGVGALAGGPLNVAAGAGLATGAGMVAASVGGLGAEAAGEDHVEPVDPEQAEPAPAPELPWEDPAVQDKLPDDWGEGQATKKGVGHRWQDPNDPGSGVRIDQGNPNNFQPTQQVDHVIVRDGGKVIGRDGEPISGWIKNNPDQSHIPLTEWKQWKSWNHP